MRSSAWSSCRRSLTPSVVAGPEAAGATPRRDSAAGLTHLREGRAELALEEIKKAVSQDDKNPYFYKGLGQPTPSSEVQGGDRGLPEGAAAQPLLRRRAQRPRHGPILSGKREEGRKEFLTAFSDPTNPTPEISSRNLGQTYLEDKNYPEAIHWFRSAIARNKIYADPYFGVADALLATGQLDEAIAQLEAGVREAPNDPAMLTGLGEVLLKAGRFTEARAQLEAAIKKDPGGAWGRRAGRRAEDRPQVALPGRSVPYLADPRAAAARRGRRPRRPPPRRERGGRGRGRSQGHAPPVDRRLSGHRLRHRPARRRAPRDRAIDQFCCRYATGTVVLTALKDDYYLIVSLAPEASLAVCLWHSALARDELNAEL